MKSQPASSGQSGLDPRRHKLGTQTGGSFIPCMGTENQKERRTDGENESKAAMWRSEVGLE